MSEPAEQLFIDAYLTRALEAWDESGTLPDDRRLREIAESVEMTNEASEAADERSQELTEQARLVLDEDDDDTAEGLLRRAVLLSPVRVEPHFLLAEIYARRFHRDRRDTDQNQAIALAQRVQKLSPDHTPSHALLEQMGFIRSNDGISWKQAGLIVLFLVFLSGSMSLCVRYTMIPDVPETATEEVRDHFERRGQPER